MEKQIQILHLEDDVIDAELVQAALDAAGLSYRITQVQTAQSFDNALRTSSYDLILADYRLPTYDGLSALNHTREFHPEIPFIFVSGTLGEDAAISALTMGAVDYVTKQKLSRLAPAIRRALQEVENQAKRKKAELELHEREKEYRVLVETSPDLIVRYDTKLRRVYVNPAWEKASGLLAKDVLNLHLSDVPNIPYPVNNEYMNALQQVLKTETSQSVEFTWVNARGETLFLEYVIVPEYNQSGKVSGLLSVGRDITERKRMEEALAAREREFRTLAENSPDNIARYDINCQTIYVNPALEKTLERPAAEMLDTFPSNAGFIKEADEYQEKIAEVLQTGKEQEMDLVLPDIGNGRRFHNVRFVAERGADGTITGVLAIGRDITERKLAENELRQNREDTLQFSKQLTALQEVTNQLSKIESFNELCRQAVQMGIPLLEVDRLSIWFIEEKLGIMQGSFGIDEQGMLRDERNSAVNFLSEGLTWLLFSNKKSMVAVTHCPLYDDKSQVVGEGDNAQAAVWDGDNVIGVISVDNLFSGQAIKEHQLEVLRLYASTLGHLIKRVRAEESLRKSEQKFRALAANIPNVVFQCRNDSRYTFVYLNDAIETLTGYSKDEFLQNGLSFFNLYHPDDLPHIPQPQNNNTSFINRKPYHIIYRIRHKSGEWRWVDEWGTGVINEKQEVDYIEGIMIDITEQKRHEREREAIITVSTALRQAENRSGILTIILEQLSILFDADGVIIAFPNAVTGDVMIETGYGPVGKRFEGLIIPNGKGISNWVIQNKRPYISNNVYQDPMFYRPDLLGNCQCVASVPLIARENSIGSLWIARETNITEQDMQLFNAIADIAANAIHRITLHEKTEQHLHHLLALHKIDLAITSNFDLKIILNIILTNVQNELKVDAASILLLSESGYLEFIAGLGFRTDNIKECHVKIGDGISGRAALEQRTISCPDLKHTSEVFSRSTLLAAEEFASHFATPLFIPGQIKGVLEVFHRKRLNPDREWFDYFETLATQAVIAIENATLLQNLQLTNKELTQAYDATIEGWSRALDLRDRETEGHTRRVTEMSLELADRMGLSEAEKADLRRGALLHDIGKMGVPDSILHKPGGLTESEWEIMRQHPTFAYQMLSPIAYLKRAVEVSYCHHEKWDGTGYPHGLKGEEIPLAARVFTVVDVFDALTSDRPYRHAWSPEEAYRYIQAHSGTHFDPQVVKVFLENREPRMDNL